MPQTSYNPQLTNISISIEGSEKFLTIDKLIFINYLLRNKSIFCNNKLFYSSMILVFMKKKE